MLKMEIHGNPMISYQKSEINKTHIYQSNLLDVYYYVILTIENTKSPDTRFNLKITTNTANLHIQQIGSNIQTKNLLAGLTNVKSLSKHLFDFEHNDYSGFVSGCSNLTGTIEEFWNSSTLISADHCFTGCSRT